MLLLSETNWFLHSALSAPSSPLSKTLSRVSPDLALLCNLATSTVMNTLLRGSEGRPRPTSSATVVAKNPNQPLKLHTYCYNLEEVQQIKRQKVLKNREKKCQWGWTRCLVRWPHANSCEAPALPMDTGVAVKNSTQLWARDATQKTMCPQTSNTFTCQSVETREECFSKNGWVH